MVGVFAFALSHGVRGSDGGGFYHSQEVQSQFVLHLSFSHRDPPVYKRKPAIGGVRAFCSLKSV